MDSDLRERLVRAHVLAPSQTPRLVSGIQKKLQSPCLNYARDYLLHCWWHDLLLARKLSALVAIADRQKVAPETLADDMQQFSGYWKHQQSKLEDICRRKKTFPTLFFTIAPAEWTFPLHAMLFPDTDLSGNQLLFTVHAYHCLCQVLERLLTNQFPMDGTGVHTFGDYTYRFEFQARGTVHVHVLAWADLLLPAQEITGRTGTASESPLLRLLEKIFTASVDVQAGNSEHCLLRYVVGYVSKASDSLTFTTPMDATSTSSWRQVWRLMQKLRPLWQEMALDFWGLPQVCSSWPSLHIYAPLPGVPHRGFHGACYVAYLRRPEHVSSMSFLQFLRTYTMRRSDGSVVQGDRRDMLAAVGVSWPYELLDIFWGAFMALMWPHRAEQELLLDAALQPHVPVTARFFWSAMLHPSIRSDDARLLAEVHEDLRWRGLSEDRLVTFTANFRAKLLLVRAALAGYLEASCWVSHPTVTQVLALLLLFSPHVALVSCAQHLWALPSRTLMYASCSAQGASQMVLGAAESFRTHCCSSA